MVLPPLHRLVRLRCHTKSLELTYQVSKAFCRKATGKCMDAEISCLTTGGVRLQSCALIFFTEIRQKTCTCQHLFLYLRQNDEIDQSCFKSFKSKKTDRKSFPAGNKTLLGLKVNVVVFFDLMDTPPAKQVKCAQSRWGRRNLGRSETLQCS